MGKCPQVGILNHRTKQRLFEVFWLRWWWWCLNSVVVYLCLRWYYCCLWILVSMLCKILSGDGQIVSKVVCQRQLSLLLLCSAEKGGTGKVPTLTLRYIFIFYLLYSEIRFHYYSFIRERAKWVSLNHLQPPLNHQRHILLGTVYTPAIQQPQKTIETFSCVGRLLQNFPSRTPKSAYAHTKLIANAISISYLNQIRVTQFRL